jgi:hypothetical protein
MRNARLRPHPTAKARAAPHRVPAGMTGELSDSVAGLDWGRIGAALDAGGFATMGPLLPADLCAKLVTQYDEAGAFRSRIVMARHGFGRGEYQYYTYPLPEAVQTLRTCLYPPLARIANRWLTLRGQPACYPGTHAAFLRHCHDRGQSRPTPLLLRYGPGDYNCLHQDLYGDVYFPLQVAFLLNEAGEDFTGGEFVLTEQRPRMQSRVEVVSLRRGEGVIFAVNHRPVRGVRGTYQVAMRHGVSRVRSGQRHTMGVIFHDAR